MPKLKRWIKAKKKVALFPRPLLQELCKLGANLGGGEFEVHQNINVNAGNREKVIELLEKNGYTIEDADD